MSACAASAPRLLNGDADVVLSSLTHDSRQVRVGSLFCCIRGEKFDGHDFAAAAVERGAVALLVQHEISNIPCRFLKLLWKTHGLVSVLRRQNCMATLHVICRWWALLVRMERRRQHIYWRQL